MSDQAPAVSIVIPAKNEAVRLPPSIRKIRSTFLNEPWEFIIVVELSTDGTVEAVREAVGGDPRFDVVCNPVARGKGYAVKTGMLRAKGDLVFFYGCRLERAIELYSQFFKSFAGGGCSHWKSASPGEHHSSPPVRATRVLRADLQFCAAFAGDYAIGGYAMRIQSLSPKGRTRNLLEGSAGWGWI